MPWTIEDVVRHHKGLSDPEKRLWVAVANQQLAEHGDEIRAIREANAVVDRYRERKRAGSTE
ncbi:MAG TPA: hypothetical protein VMA77_30190 [Solirubrobacteraceae bacterium]|nr:hypothetical protein [Solirubrobacteraceae bacterium]